MCKQAPDCDHHPYADAVTNHNVQLPSLELIHDIVPLVRKCDSARKILRVSKGVRLDRPLG